MTNLRWFIRELIKPFFRPIVLAGGFLDFIRGWRASCLWRRFWFSLPAIVLIFAFYVAYVASIITPQSLYVQTLTDESIVACSTSALDRWSDAQLDRELASLGSLSEMHELLVVKEEVVSTSSLRYIELLSKRVLEMDPTNVISKYRLALVYSLHDRMPEAVECMKDVATGKDGDYWQANAWVAKHQLLEGLKNAAPMPSDFAINLEKASRLRDVDHRLLLMYAHMLEARGESAKAISVTKKAAISKPELNLELASMYKRAGNDEAAIEAAITVEDHFGKRLFTVEETDSDRLAVSDAMRFSDRLEEAARVLEHGLFGGRPRPALNRQLSKIRIELFRKTVKQNEAGEYKANFAILESAVEADPNNPLVSEEVAHLLQFRLAPTTLLMDTLKRHVDDRITSQNTNMRLAENFYIMGNVSEAIRFWEICIEQNPKNVDAMNNLAVSLAKAKPDDMKRPIELLERALENSPRHPELLDSYGEVLMLANRPKEAINKFELSIRLDAKRFATRKKLVMAYRQMGMLEMADAVNKTVADDPDSNASDEMK